MTATPSNTRLTKRRRWLVGAGIPGIGLVLAVASSSFLSVELSLAIFSLGLALSSGIFAGLGAVTLKAARSWAVFVLLVLVATWTINSWTEIADRPVLAVMLLFPLVLLLLFIVPVGFGLAVGVVIARWHQDRRRSLLPLAVYAVLAVLAWIVWTFVSPDASSPNGAP